MPLKYEVTGYDRRTGRLSVSYDVPVKSVAEVKRIAGIPPSDDGLGSYPLDATQVAKIARALRTGIGREDCDFLLEPYEEEPARSR
jgi:hypothetical protein